MLSTCIPSIPAYRRNDQTELTWLTGYQNHDIQHGRHTSPESFMVAKALSMVSALMPRVASRTTNVWYPEISHPGIRSLSVLASRTYCPPGWWSYVAPVTWLGRQLVVGPSRFPVTTVTRPTGPFPSKWAKCRPRNTHNGRTILPLANPVADSESPSSYSCFTVTIVYLA